ncbi:tRNA methyltransferase complex GCD14 subunit-domain-containing protein [Gongronella butleri]|nr:tRNA methyltransferase complex GCD14 subunit-domain-containing protein [Gongronella butleri]
MLYHRDNQVAVTIKAGEELNNRFGAFMHDDIIGKEYGSRIVSRNAKGYIYVLHPTPELWTMVVPHRTQILYLPDISFISLYLDMKPGSHVLECGTGSGSFSHSIARTVAPHGKLYTFEYHGNRAMTARNEFEAHGLGDIITLEHRDVCKNGFGLKDAVNCAFLDLPAPWEAIGSAKEAFKQHRTGKICTFSPCIEQVSRSVQALYDHGFVDITMFECLMREHNTVAVNKITMDEAIAAAKVKMARNKANEPRAAGRKRKAEDDTTEKTIVTKTGVDCRGHTSYLTFATFLPAIQDDVTPANGDDTPTSTS